MFIIDTISDDFLAVSVSGMDNFSCMLVDILVGVPFYTESVCHWKSLVSLHLPIGFCFVLLLLGHVIESLI